MKILYKNKEDIRKFKDFPLLSPQFSKVIARPMWGKVLRTFEEDVAFLQKSTSPAIPIQH